jgi:hypothetical protein
MIFSIVYDLGQMALTRLAPMDKAMMQMVPTNLMMTPRGRSFST